MKEGFLELAEIKSFDAQSIAHELQQQIQNNGLAELNCVAQTYDGAAVMSGFLEVYKHILEGFILKQSMCIVMLMSLTWCCAILTRPFQRLWSFSACWGVCTLSSATPQ